jgi:hypothetical protein
MIIRTSKEEIEHYIASSAVNQSKLKLLTVSAQAFQEVKEPEMFFEEKEHFVIGRAVDDWITQGDEYFITHYHLGATSKPSDVIMSIIQQTFATRTVDDWFEQNLLPAIEAHNYQPNWKPDTKIAKVSTEGERYWKELLYSQGKTVLSVEQYTKVQNIVSELFNNRFTESYFRSSAQKHIYYQLPIYFELNNVQCKALLDMVIVDHVEKEITLIDIKTIGDYTKNFDYQCLRRRYDIQIAWYMKAILHWAKINHFGDYNLNFPKFIVASSTKVCDSIVFNCTSSFLNVGAFGTLKYQDYKVNAEEEEMQFVESTMYGYTQLLEMYKWHEENGWNYDYEIEMKKGEFTIDSSFKRQ